MITRIRELTVLFACVFALTFLLSKTKSLLQCPPEAILPLSPTAATRLLLQPPDQHIAIPLRSVRIREIHDSWHAPRSGRRRHEGQDIFAPVGTPVYSATNGIAIRIGYKGKGGHAVSVLGPGGLVYYYAHLASFGEHLRIGDTVTPNTMLGYVGRTGNARSTPAHLHFGVYCFAGAINPLPLLVNPVSSLSPEHGSKHRRLHRADSRPLQFHSLGA